jgi:hypothetical protein
MLKTTDRLIEAGARFLTSKTIETYTNIWAMIITTAFLVILTAWVFHQVRAFGAVWGI